MNEPLKITLEAARVNAGYNQKEAAKQLKISPSTLGKYEAKASYPNVRMISEMEKLYQISKDNIKW